MATRRGTTPTFTITVEGMTFQGYRVYVTLEDSAGTQITKDTTQNACRKEVIYDDNNEPIGCKISVSLTQEESFSLDVGSVQVQLTWIDVYGVVDKSDIEKIKLDRTLLEEEVSYG